MNLQLPKDGPRGISDVKDLQEMVVVLLNELSKTRTELAQTRSELQSALDEINRLKGEQGRPKFKKAKKIPKLSAGDKTVNTESVSTKAKEENRIPIDRELKFNEAPDGLPEDAVFKGYRSVIQRNVRIVRDNIKFHIGRWYSASTNKTYEAELPSDYRGQIGSELLSLVQMMHHCCNMTHSAISDLLTHLRVPLSTGCISNLLTQSEWAEEERSAVLKTGLGSASFINIDSTLSMEWGKRKYTQVIGSPHFSLYYTQVGKSRLDIYAALQGKSRKDVLLKYTSLALERMRDVKVSKKHIAYFKANLEEGKVMSMEELDRLFDSDPIFAKTNLIRRSCISSALAAGYYFEQTQMPIVKCIITDDAHEYNKIATQHHMLCWIHEIRHYRKMVTSIDYYRQILENFIGRLWKFYARIKVYREVPLGERQRVANEIKIAFHKLFADKTDYERLNEQISKTSERATQLLAFLENPAFPVHNNDAERNVRRVVRKRDISFHTCSERGTKMRDVFMSLFQTAKLHGISFMDYLIDRNTGTYSMQSLAETVSKAGRNNTTTL